jgi:hypothetical protein
MKKHALFMMPAVFALALGLQLPTERHSRSKDVQKPKHWSFTPMQPETIHSEIKRPIRLQSDLPHNQNRKTNRNRHNNLQTHRKRMETHISHWQTHAHMER